MPEKVWSILVPEYVPLENKGEEAIIRGIGDVLFPKGNVELHVFDTRATEYRFHDGIHVYPGKWFFPIWTSREFGLGLNWEKIRDSACSLLRNGLHKLKPDWVSKTPRCLRDTLEQMCRLDTERGKDVETSRAASLRRILECDYVIAGHDGALNEYVCHTLKGLVALGFEYGIFGMEIRPKFRSAVLLHLFRETFSFGKFFYCRNPLTLESSKTNFPETSFHLIGDPAFGMRPACEKQVDELILREGLGDLFDRPVIAITCCEPAPIARHCFKADYLPKRRLRAHRKLFADLLNHVLQKYAVNVLFLPHAIGPGKVLDDRIIARDIAKQACFSRNRIRLLETAYSARILKRIIGKSDFLIAERIHSIIAATGVSTPFLCMGSETDRRIKGIVEHMLGFSEAVYYLNRPHVVDLCSQFDEVYGRRTKYANLLTQKSAHLKAGLDAAARTVRRHIECGGTASIRNS